MSEQAFPDSWPRVWRGESSGELFETFDLGQTQAGVGFFFALSHAHAQFYAGHGTQPRPFVLDPGQTLDVCDPIRAWRDPQARAVLEEVQGLFDDWVCRRSGEERDLVSYLEAGDLYDYEGTGSGQRWNALFKTAHAFGYDSVCVRDYTDGVAGEESVVWVVFDPARIHADPKRPSPSTGRSRKPAL